MLKGLVDGPPFKNSCLLASLVVIVLGSMTALGVRLVGSDVVEGAVGLSGSGLQPESQVAAVMINGNAKATVVALACRV